MSDIPRKKRLSPGGLLQAAGCLVCLLTVAGFAGCLYWFFDLASHFRMQYLLVLVLLAPTAFLMKQRRSAALFLTLALVNVLAIAPLYVPGTKNARGSARLYRLLLINVNVANEEYGRVMDFIREQAPDFFVIEEFNHRWHSALLPLRAMYPYGVADPREDCFGIALFSRIPPEDTRVFHIGDAGVPSVMARVVLDGSLVTLFATHPLPPAGSAYSALRDQQIDLLPDILSAYEDPLILVGDLNVSPWACRFNRLLREADLRDSTRGFGFQPTWPSKPALLRIPIDHFLHSPDIGIADRRIGPPMGSDHMPLVVDFYLPQ